jgi:hypothetical protein
MMDLDNIRMVRIHARAAEQRIIELEAELFELTLVCDRLRDDIAELSVCPHDGEAACPRIGKDRCES